MSQPELRKKKIHQFHVSACNNAGNDRFSQCLCLFDGLFVVRKTKFTAKLQIRSIAVPFRIQKDADVIGIGLFGDSMELKTLYENMFGKSFLSMDDISDLPSLISGRMKDIVRSW